MKAVKGRFLRTLKYIPSIVSIKQVPAPEKPSCQKLEIPPVCEEQDGLRGSVKGATVGCGVVLSEHVKDLKDEGVEMELSPSNKGDDSDYDAAPSIMSKEKEAEEASSKQDIMMVDHHELEDSQENPSLSDYEEKWPSGGSSESIIFYTTSMRSIRKTFEECSSIRFLLESFKVKFSERDISMNLEFREELWGVLGGRVIPPRLFIKGRYIGGADEVVGLHEQGKLRKLLEGLPLEPSNSPCSGCANLRFLVCPNCHGSNKMVKNDGDDDLWVRCTVCNENGLVKCPICC